MLISTRNKSAALWKTFVLIIFSTTQFTITHIWYDDNFRILYQILNWPFGLQYPHTQIVYGTLEAFTAEVKVELVFLCMPCCVWSFAFHYKRQSSVYKRAQCIWFPDSWWAILVSLLIAATLYERFKTNWNQLCSSGSDGVLKWFCLTFVTGRITSFELEWSSIRYLLIRIAQVKYLQSFLHWTYFCEN